METSPLTLNQICSKDKRVDSINNIITVTILAIIHQTNYVDDGRLGLNLQKDARKKFEELELLATMINQDISLQTKVVLYDKIRI